MKKFDVINMHNSQFCCVIEAKNQKSALNKFKKNLLSSGFYWIEKVNDYRYALLSSFGCEYSAYAHSPINGD